MLFLSCFGIKIGGLSKWQVHQKQCERLSETSFKCSLSFKIRNFSQISFKSVLSLVGVFSWDKLWFLGAGLYVILLYCSKLIFVCLLFLRLYDFISSLTFELEKTFSLWFSRSLLEHFNCKIIFGFLISSWLIFSLTFLIIFPPLGFRPRFLWTFLSSFFGSLFFFFLWSLFLGVILFSQISNWI